MSRNKFKKGSIPWNKGIKLPEKIRRKVVAAGTKSLIAYNKSRKGKHLTLTHKRKLSKALKGRIITQEHRKKLSKALKGRTKFNDYGLFARIKSLLRLTDKYKQWREAVFKRDHYTCKQCNKTGGRLEADHIKPFSKIVDEFLKLYTFMTEENIIKAALNYAPLWDINNGRTLCIKCHKTTDTYGFKAKDWK
jgi:hypothetical protein